MISASSDGAGSVANVVIVGGGVAAHRCAFRLRQLGYERRISMVSAEAVPPYDRTALSKSTIGPTPVEPSPLSSDEAYRDAEIELRLGARARELQSASRTLICDDGWECRYDRVLIATGAKPVLPPDLRAPGILTLREANDLPALIQQVDAARRVAIVGGGLIGCELSSSLAKKGQLVTIIEAGPGPLHQVAGEDIGSRLLELHRAAGVNVLANSAVARLQSAGDGNYELRLTNGNTVVAECVVVAVGSRPATAWLADSGVPVDGAVTTNEYCETTVPGVFAAGDCASFPSRRLGRRVRLEHWDSAARHGATAAANMLGDQRPFDPVPFFWSDQHAIKLAMAGLPGGGERVTVDRDPGSLLVTFDGAAGPTAGAGLNRTKEIVELRRRLEGNQR